MDNWFRERREQLELSQFEMAVRVGMTPGTLSLWERFRIVPKTPIAKLAEVYQVSTAVIEKQLTIQRREVEKRQAGLATAK